MLSQLVPYPPDSGAKIRCLNVIKQLSKRHKVTLVAFARRQEEFESADELLKYCDEVKILLLKRSKAMDLVYLLKSLVSLEPFSIVRDFRHEMMDTVRALVSKSQYDVVHIDQLNMTQYATSAVEAVKILDQHNVVNELYRRMFEKTSIKDPRKILLYIEYLKMRRYEACKCSEVDAVMTVTKEDRELLKAIAPDQSRYRVVPIGVDVDCEWQGANTSSKKICFVGTLSYEPNIDGLLWFCRSVLPLIRRRVPSTQVIVIGRASSRLVADFAKVDGIQFLGYVDDVESVMRDSAVSIVPLRIGSGMRVKILDSLVCGTPIVSTSIGCEGVDVTDGKDILIADTKERFADAVIRALTDQNLANDLSRNGFDLVVNKYRWQSVYAELDKVYADTFLAVRGASTSIDTQTGSVDELVFERRHGGVGN